MNWLLGLIPVGLAFIYWAFKRAVDQQVGPLAADLRRHMDTEQQDTADIRVGLERIAGQFAVNEAEHAAMDSRIKRLEDHG